MVSRGFLGCEYLRSSFTLKFQFQRQNSPLRQTRNDDHENDGVDVEQKVADVADLLLDVLFDDVSYFLNDVNNFLAMMLRFTKAEMMSI